MGSCYKYSGIWPGTTIVSKCLQTLKPEEFLGFSTFKHPMTSGNLCTSPQILRSAPGVESDLSFQGTEKGGHFVGYLAEYQLKQKYFTKKEWFWTNIRAPVDLYPPTHNIILRQNRLVNCYVRLKLKFIHPRFGLASSYFMNNDFYQWNCSFHD